MIRAIGWAAPLLLIVIGLLLATWIVRRAESRLAFFPLRGEDDTPASFGIDYTPLTVETTDGERIRLWHVLRPNPRARVVYFHGNGGNLSLWGDVLAGLWREGFEVIAIDYRGYGESTGSPSERGLYLDVEATLRAVERLPDTAPIPLIYWGRSLGTTMAAYAATRQAPDGIILESGFPSMRAVVRSNPVLWVLSWLSSYRFPTAEWMASVTQPTLVLHGDRDSVIPYGLGRQLHDALAGPKTFVTIPGGDHNEATPPDPVSYWRAIHAFVDGLRSPPIT